MKLNRRGFLAFSTVIFPANLTVAHKPICTPKVPTIFPTPKFGFGAKVRHQFDDGWKEGEVIGLIWNVQTQEWDYQVFWDEQNESCLVSLSSL